MCYRGFYNLRSVKDNIELTEQNRAELDRCRDDIFYFIRNYVYINSRFGCNLMQLTPQQEQELKKMLDPSDQRVLTDWYRQSGYSTLMAAFFLHKALFNNDKYYYIGCYKKAIAREKISVIREMYLKLPMWMQVPVTGWTKQYIKLNNGSRIVGIHLTYQNTHGYCPNYMLFEEFGFINPKRAENILASMIPTLASAKSTHIYFTNCNVTGTSPAAKILWKSTKDWRKSTYHWYNNPELTDSWRDEKVKTLGKDLFTLYYGPVDRPEETK